MNYNLNFIDTKVHLNVHFNSTINNQSKNNGIYLYYKEEKKQNRFLFILSRTLSIDYQWSIFTGILTKHNSYCHDFNHFKQKHQKTDSGLSDLQHFSFIGNRLYCTIPAFTFFQGRLERYSGSHTGYTESCFK